MPPAANAQNQCRPRCWIDWSVWEDANRLFERATHGGTRIELSVCMDEGVMLVFNGIGTRHTTIVVATSEDDLRRDETLLRSASDANDGS